MNRKKAKYEKIIPETLTKQKKAAFTAAEQEIYRLLIRKEYSLAKTKTLAIPYGDSFPAEKLRVLCIVSLESGKTDDACLYAEAYNQLANDGNSGYYWARARFAAGERSSLIPMLEEALTKTIASDNEMRCHNLLAQLYRRCGNGAKAVQEYRQAYETGFSSNIPISLALTEYDNFLFNSHYIPYDPQLLAMNHFHYGDIVAEHVAPLTLISHNDTPRKIRVGYISPDFREHAVLAFSMAFFACSDKKKYDIYAYARCQEDTFSQPIKNYAHWKNISSLNDEHAARIIMDDELDILVDLAGHTQGNVLGVIAYKPAPVIISGIGYFSTTGLKTVDYFLSDVHLAGTDKQGIYEHPLFREKLIVLPKTHWCYTPLHPRKASSLIPPVRKNGFITFGSFNAMAKANDRVLNAWAEILRRVPKSRLLLKGETFSDLYDRNYMKTRLLKAGIDLSRAELRATSSDYLDQYADVDIALDTFPYGGGATTMDALYMSVPVISLAGETHHSRFGHSILSNLGLSELSCNTVDEYIERTRLIAGDIETLDALHANIRKLLERSPLMDSIGYMLELEALYQNICSTTN